MVCHVHDIAVRLIRSLGATAFNLGEESGWDLRVCPAPRLHLKISTYGIHKTKTYKFSKVEIHHAQNVDRVQIRREKTDPLGGNL